MLHGCEGVARRLPFSSPPRLIIFQATMFCFLSTGLDCYYIRNKELVDTLLHVPTFCASSLTVINDNNIIIYFCPL